MRSYAIHRPIGPFTWPSEHKDMVLELVNFDHMEYVPEIGRNAFGYIDWADGVPMEDLRRYELVVPTSEDRMLTKIGKVLAQLERKEQWDRFERAWSLAMERYGYSDDELERVWMRFSDLRE